MVDLEGQLDPVAGHLSLFRDQAGVVDEHVDPRERVRQRAHRGQRREVGQVHAGRADLLRDRRGTRLVAAVDEHVEPRAARSAATTRPRPSVAPVTRTVVMAGGWTGRGSTRPPLAGRRAHDQVVGVLDEVADHRLGQPAVELDRVPVALVEVVAGVIAAWPRAARASSGSHLRLTAAARPPARDREDLPAHLEHGRLGRERIRLLGAGEAEAQLDRERPWPPW